VLSRIIAITGCEAQNSKVKIAIYLQIVANFLIKEVSVLPFRLGEYPKISYLPRPAITQTFYMQIRVGNLNTMTTTTQLAELFLPYGKVFSARIVNHGSKGVRRILPH
jgi:hypothetical protein